MSGGGGKKRANPIKNKGKGFAELKINSFSQVEGESMI